MDQRWMALQLTSFSLTATLDMPAAILGGSIFGNLPPGNSLPTPMYDIVCILNPSSMHSTDTHLPLGIGAESVLELY